MMYRDRRTNDGWIGGAISLELSGSPDAKVVFAVLLRQSRTAAATHV